MKCGVINCQNEAVYRCQQTVGKQQVIHTCEDHKPGAGRDKLPADSPIRNVPIFYEITAI